jgi:hypothetical protein
MGDTWYYSPSVWGGGHSILHPKYFDDDVALSCEYVSEGFEFSYIVRKKFFARFARIFIHFWEKSYET